MVCKEEEENINKELRKLVDIRASFGDEKFGPIKYNAATPYADENADIRKK